MSVIKQYQKIRPNDKDLTFDIKRMEALYDKFGGQPDEPHRHDYYTIILINQAKGKHIIDFQSFDLKQHQVYFISPGQVHQMIEYEKSFGCVITFSRQFLYQNGIEEHFIENLHLFQDFGYSPPLQLEEDEFQTISTITSEILSFIYSNKKFKYQAVGALLQLLLIHCNNACSLSKEENTQTIQASVVLLRNFKQLLNENYKDWHKVSDYAKAMHITSDYLNASVKSLTGKSAKEHIQSRIIVAAKRLLHFSDWTTKKIAYELGFSEPANFSQFFKKCTGISPSKF